MTRPALLLALLAACGPSGSSQTYLGHPTPQGPFTVSVVSGDNQTGPAVQSLVGAVSSQTSPTTWSISYPPGAAPGGANARPLPQLLTVLVLDAQGKPAPGVIVLFTAEWDASAGPSYYSPLGVLVGPEGLGTITTDQTGQAGAPAIPYSVGVQHATTRVRDGASNSVTFTVMGQ